LFFGIKGSLSGAGAQLTNNACRPRAADCLSVWYMLLSLIGSASVCLGCETVNSHFSAFRQIEELQAQLITGKAAQDELDSLLKSGVCQKPSMKRCARLIKCEWQEQKRHWGSIIAARMSLTPKLAITLNSMPSAAAYCWQKRSTK